jgi:hypothetical protein
MKLWTNMSVMDKSGMRETKGIWKSLHLRSSTMSKDLQRDKLIAAEQMVGSRSIIAFSGI